MDIFDLLMFFKLLLVFYVYGCLASMSGCGAGAIPTKARRGCRIHRDCGVNLFLCRLWELNLGTERWAISWVLFLKDWYQLLASLTAFYARKCILLFLIIVYLSPFRNMGKSPKMGIFKRRGWNTDKDLFWDRVFLLRVGCRSQAWDPPASQFRLRRLTGLS